MANYQSSQVVVNETKPTRPRFVPNSTSDTAFVGVTERGPLTARLVESFDEYERVFGGYTANSELPQSVYAFFQEGGGRSWIQRVVHYTDPTDPDTKASALGTTTISTAASAPTAATITSSNAEPFELAAGATISIDVDGGGPAVATFDAAAGFRTSANTEPFALADGQTLELSVDGGSTQTVTFLTLEFVAIGAATAAEVAAVINAKISGGYASAAGGAVTVTSDTEGTDSSVEITGGTAAATFAFPAGAGAGSGDVADISAVTAAELAAVIDADIAGLSATALIDGRVQLVSDTTGPTSTLQVSAGTVTTEVGFTTATISGSSGAPAPTLRIDGASDGAYTDTVTVTISEASNGDADRFDISVLDDGVVVVGERYRNLSMDAADPQYVETVLAGSNLVAAVDLELDAADRRPADGTYGPLAGGDDGLTGLVDADFVGGKGVNGSTGLRGIDATEAVILTVPGRSTATVANAMVTYCEVTRVGALIAIPDPPAGMTEDEVIEYYDVTAALVGLSTFVVLYWPRVTIPNPDEDVFGTDDSIVVPLSGAVAGRWARTDASRAGGIYQPPAGNNQFGQFRFVDGVETTRVQEQEVRDKLYRPKRINPIRANDDGVVYLDGTFTARENDNFPRITHRRAASYIEQTVAKGLDPYRHFPNTSTLRQEIARQVSDFLQTQLRLKAFATNDPATAFSVDFGDGLNTPDLVDKGELNGRIALRFAESADVIILEFGRLNPLNDLV